MNRDSSLDNNPMEGSQDSEKTSEMSQDVPKCLTKEEWTKLGNLSQRICVYMKEAYEVLIGQGLNTVPGSMHPNNQTTEAGKHDSDEAQDPRNHVLELTESKKEETNVWVGRLRERKNHIVYEEISDPEEDDELWM
uniref:KRAB-related domain-containing protein n=1 Tax=Myotis myotis TaxID=51298 RepID=A0A7J7YDE8_MYOMY|nr:hypothetical protein mMyoMyo1_010944 [Myotis myotis]